MSEFNAAKKLKLQPTHDYLALTEEAFIALIEEHMYQEVHVRPKLYLPTGYDFYWAINEELVYEAQELDQLKAFFNLVETEPEEEIRAVFETYINDTLWDALDRIFGGRTTLNGRLNPDDDCFYYEILIEKKVA